jgi:hypothetical protein
MKHKFTQTSFERARQILEIYGGDPTVWPEHERQAMQQVINTSKELQALQQQAMELDALIDQADTSPAGDPVGEQQLMERILRDLPEQAANVTDLQQLPRRQNRAAKLRLPAMLSAVAASVIVFMVVLQQPDSVLQPDATPAQEAFEQWAWADITDQVMESNQEDVQGVRGFMGLIDLEADEV